MTKIFVERVRKITILIFLSSLISLIFISILPCFAIEDIEGNIIYYNIESIKNSDDKEIKTLFETLNLIVISNWVLIIFTLLSFIGTILIISNKYSNIAKIIMLMVCANIIFSALSVVLSWNLIKSTGEINNAHFPFILSGIAINYQYIPFISFAFSLFGSILYLIIVSNFYFKYFMGFKKQKKIEKKPSKEKKAPSESLKQEVKVFVNKSIPQKTTSVPQQPSVSKKEESFEGYIQEDHADSEQYPVPERRLQTRKDLIPDEEPVDVKGPYEKPFEKDIEPDKPKQEEYPEKKEQEIPSPFEKALSSAVEKRQLSENKVEELPKQSPLKKRLSIRCPECKNIFTVEKEEGVLETKIECPKCGRKGVIKQ